MQKHLFRTPQTKRNEIFNRVSHFFFCNNKQKILRINITKKSLCFICKIDIVRFMKELKDLTLTLIYPIILLA